MLTGATGNGVGDGCGGAIFGVGAGAAATTVVVVATLSDDVALAFVSCSDSVRAGLTTTGMIHAYERPLTGCAAFARTV